MAADDAASDTVDAALEAASETLEAADEAVPVRPLPAAIETIAGSPAAPGAC